MSDHNKDHKDSIWHNSNFVVLLTTGVLIGFGGRVYELALPLIIYELTQSSVAMGTMRAVEFLPNLLLAMVVGVFVDRADKKRWMMTTVLLQILVLISLYAYVQFQHVNLLVFYGAGFFLMLLNYAYANAKISSTKLALPTPMLISANSKFTFIQTLMQVMGPAISGAILFLSSLYYGLLMTAVMYLLALLILSRLHLQEAPPIVQSRHFWMELKEGWLALRENRPLWVITWYVVLLNATSGAYEVMLIFYVKDELQWSTALVGAVLSCAGIGGVLGSLVTERIRRAWGLGMSLALSIVALAIIYVFTGVFHSPVATGLALLGFGFITTIQNILIWTCRHETTPAPLIGRVSGITGSIFKLGLPFAVFGSGYLAAFSGARAVFVVCAIVQVFVYAAFCYSSVMKVSYR